DARALRRLARRRGEDDEAAEVRDRLPCGRSEVADQRPGDAEQEHIEQREEQDADDPDREDVAIHQASSNDSTTRIVSPTRIWSPSPSAISSTRRSFTHEPFVLPRSARSSAPRRPYSRAWCRETRPSNSTRPLSGAR